MSYATVGVDIAKSVMQLHWVEPETGFKCSPPAIPQKIARRRALSPNRTFRATGITAYLKNGGTLENAAAMANHASTRTTQLYDRRGDDGRRGTRRTSIRGFRSKRISALGILPLHAHHVGTGCTRPIVFHRESRWRVRLPAEPQSLF
jgi:hypothetical protein